MAAPACTTVPVYDIHEDTGEILFTKAQMQQRVVEMGQQIGKDYQGLSPVLMPILKGGFIFAAGVECSSTYPSPSCIQGCFDPHSPAPQY
jgi:hypothetical protein